jgi:hypothetical protein
MYIFLLLFYNFIGDHFGGYLYVLKVRIGDVKLFEQWRFLLMKVFLRTPKFLDGFNCEFKGEDSRKRRNWGALFSS